MRLKTLIAAGAALGVLAAPAVADAHRNADYKDVRAHVRAADKALDRAVRYVNRGSVSRAAKQLRAHRREVRGAIKDARTALRRARSAREVSRVALAYRSLGAQQTADITRYTELLGADLPASLAKQVAAIVKTAIGEREQVLDRLTGLLGKLPKSSRGKIAGWVRQLVTDGQAHVGALVGLLSEMTFPPDVQNIMARALDLAFGAIDAATSRLGDLVGMLPGPAREPVRLAIEQVEATMVMVRGILESLVGSLPVTEPGELPDFSQLLPKLKEVLPGLGGVLPSVQELMGNFQQVLPNLQELLGQFTKGLPLGDGGQQGLSGLLDQVQRLLPGLGDLLGGLGGQVEQPGGGSEGGSGGQGANLIENLLGGLLGGLFGGRA